MHNKQVLLGTARLAKANKQQQQAVSMYCA